MATRRGFLAGLMAAGLTPKLGWAQAGHPAFLGAGRVGDDDYRLFGVDAAGHRVFDVPLPARGHAGAAHPQRAEAVAFARRPGTFAIVVDCITGEVRARLESPEGRHFMGHGCFSQSGEILYTPENAYEEGRGVIGLWDAANGYARLGEFASHGVGPHDIRLMPDKRALVIANGGIDTHPESGRTKLNIPIMEPSLVYVTLDGTLLEKVTLDPVLHKNSIRHLALGRDGTVGFAMQWEGDLAQTVPLLGLHKRGSAVRLLQAPEAAQRAMKAYAGSIALSGDETQVAISSPRGGRVQVFDVARGAYLGEVVRADVCGLGPADQGFTFSTGTGQYGEIHAGHTAWTTDHPCQWDNHLIPVG